MSAEGENINLFWTGGWDSTFQLLRLLLDYGLPVTPYYLIDEARKSTGLELQAMKRIKDELGGRYPRTGKLLAPVRYFGVSDIPPDAEIESAFHAIRRRRHIGAQYHWLARFCKHNSISGVHLCIEKYTSAHPNHFSIARLVREEKDGPVPVFRIDPAHRGTPEYALFRYFSFPTLNLSKPEMAETARRKDWEAVMGLTCFCNRPRKNLKPCGICAPCIMAMKEGMSGRLTWSGRAAYRFYRPARLFVKKLLRREQ